ncbi:MAG: ATP-binding protein [Victivallaceae bacterium]|nr:ATP-binding protein [Victivallaceae bacterium]
MSNFSETDWENIIYRGVESEELDYKAAVDWRKLNRIGKSKFVRHCLAMANTKGGYIVVGVGEDAAGQPSLFTGLTPEQAKSFDPTIIGNFVNRYADPEIDFTIERPLVNAKRYAIFVIRPFSDIPHVCAYGLNDELQEGVFYIRTADAASRDAHRAGEIHAIIQRALRNQRELLGRMIRGVLYENRDVPVQNAASHFREDAGNGKLYFLRRRAPKDQQKPAVLMQLLVCPAQYTPDRFTLSEIKRAAGNSFSLLSEPHFVTEKDLDESYFSNVALRSLPNGELKMWQIFKTGMFHYLAYWPTPDNRISYQYLLRFGAEAVSFLARLYSELGYAEELLDLTLRLNDVEDVELVETPQPENRKNSQYLCRIPDIRLTLQRSAADLASGRVEHVSRIIKELCERFNFPDGRHGSLRKNITAYLEKRP